MSTQNNTMKFVRLDAAAREMGAQSKRQFLADLRTLTDRERRAVADLVRKGGGQ